MREDRDVGRYFVSLDQGQSRARTQAIYSAVACRCCDCAVCIDSMFACLCVTREANYTRCMNEKLAAFVIDHLSRTSTSATEFGKAIGITSRFYRAYLTPVGNPFKGVSLSPEKVDEMEPKILQWLIDRKAPFQDSDGEPAPKRAKTEAKSQAICAFACDSRVFSGIVL